MADRFRVLLVDDGELDDVRDCLLAMGAEFAHLRGGAVPAKLEPPRDVFITSTRHATLARAWPKQDASGRPVRIAVVSEDSGTLRATLRQMGFTFLVRRPVHRSRCACCCCTRSTKARSGARSLASRSAIASR
jgi:hypothetical protein